MLLKSNEQVVAITESSLPPLDLPVTTIASVTGRPASGDCGGTLLDVPVTMIASVTASYSP